MMTWASMERNNRGIFIKNLKMLRELRRSSYRISFGALKPRPTSSLLMLSFDEIFPRPHTASDRNSLMNASWPSRSVT